MCFTVRNYSHTTTHVHRCCCSCAERDPATSDSILDRNEESSLRRAFFSPTATIVQVQRKKKSIRKATRQHHFEVETMLKKDMDAKVEEF